MHSWNVNENLIWQQCIEVTFGMASRHTEVDVTRLARDAVAMLVYQFGKIKYCENRVIAQQLIVLTLLKEFMGSSYTFQAIILQ